MKPSLDRLITQVRSRSIYVPDAYPSLIYRLERADKIEPSAPGFRNLLDRIGQALNIRQVKKSQVVDLWPLDLWEYNRREYEHFSRHPEEFTGFSECGIARVLSHIVLTLDTGRPAYLFVMYNMVEQGVDLREEIDREDYETFLENLPF